VNLKRIRRVAMIGAGTMGAGIGLCFARAGYEVTLFSKTHAGLERAARHVRRSLDLFVREGGLSAEMAGAAERRIRTTTRLKTALDGAQFVVESAPEQLTLKQTLFRKVEALCATDTILATNTSGLSITAVASACARPRRVVGWHWANPAEFVPLVEVTPGQKTSPATVNVTYQLSEKLGKLPVLIRKEIPGFASNRLQFAVLREALHLVAEGVVSAQDVDRVLKGGVGFRYPWLGPLETSDLGGLDVFHAIASYLFKELSAAAAPPQFFSALVREGKLGIKAGAGFYEYAEGDRERILNERDQFFVRQLRTMDEIRSKGK
jgi:3-hydroxybutyryl-CoA dehydrogenase